MVHDQIEDGDEEAAGEDSGEVGGRRLGGGGPGRAGDARRRGRGNRAAGAALGVTKGSFYWHFVDRAALLQAVLARWEQRATDSVITWLAAVDDPRGDWSN